MESVSTPRGWSVEANGFLRDENGMFRESIKDKYVLYVWGSHSPGGTLEAYYSVTILRGDPGREAGEIVRNMKIYGNVYVSRVEIKKNGERQRDMEMFIPVSGSV